MTDHEKYEQQMDAELEYFASLMAEAASANWKYGDGYGGYVLEVIARHAGEQTFRTASESFAPSKKKKRISSSLRTQVYERDGYACVTCGVMKDLSCDHIMPEKLGGPTTLENLQTMCRPCNSKKGVKFNTASTA